MDLRNLCSKVDVDAIRAKIPPLPQIKLPKSVSKLKSRKIFHISRDDFSSMSRRASSKRTAAAKSENIAIPLGAPYPIPPSEFIDRTPTRISTISSLMNHKSSRDGSGGRGSRMWQSQHNDDDDENSYRNAGGIDDYYPSPMSQRMSRPISPVRSPHLTHPLKAHSEQNVKMSFGEKLQKSYKNLTEIKLKHLFAKRTVVHADKIEVNNYIHSFDEDRKRDEKIQRKIDRDIADNYRFQFKVSQQKSEESILDYDSSDSFPENVEPITNHKQLSELSGDESGMESSPPKRTPGIAATRFSRVRHTPLNMSLEDEKYDEQSQVISYEKSTESRQHQQKSTQQIRPLNMSQEEVIDFDDDDDIQLEEVESPKMKPNKKSQSRQSPRRKSAKGIAATAVSRERNAAINRTHEEDLDVDDDDFVLNEMEEVESPKLKHSKQSLHNNKKLKSPEKSTNSRQNLRKSIKGIASSAFSKDRRGPFNQTQEEELDIDGGDVEINELEDVQSPIIKPTRKPIQENKKSRSPENFKDSRQLPRRKSAKGIASSAFAKDRDAPINKTQEEDLDIDDSNVESQHVEEMESPIMKQSKISFEKSKNSQQKSQRNMSLDEDSNDDDYDMHENIELNVVEEVNSPKIKPNSSSLYDIKKHKSNENPRKSKSIKERITLLTKQKLEGNESNKEVSERKRRAPLSPEQSVDNDGTRKSDKPFDAIKHNIKRIHKSMKIPQQSGTLSENEDAHSENTTKQSKAQQFSEHLKRFRSTDNVDKTSEDGEYNKSPMHNITNKLQEWKKSIKKKVDSRNVENDDDYGTHSPQRQVKPVGSLIKKLKHIRSRRRDSTDDPDEDEEGGETYKESLASRAKLQLEKGAVAASQMPQKTMKKISETKKFFKKKQEENDGKKKPTVAHTDEEELDEGEGRVKSSPKNVEKAIPFRPPPPIPRPYFNNPSSEEEDDDVDNQKFITKSIAESQLIAVPAAATAVWTTKPILSDDTTDYEEDLPRVVLHQDNSNVFESTLIIAVTRPISCTTSPIITELSVDSEEESTPDTKPDNWIPNQDKIATFLEMTPPSQRRLSKDSNARVHSRIQSNDSSSDDSWIKDIPKGPSTAVHLNENEQPWKIQKGNGDNNLYKTKSIDLFEMQKQHGGVSYAFEDFDDELRNTPVVKIENEIIPVDETETDDNEEFKDFDDDYQTPPPVIKKENEITPTDEMETDEFKDFDDDVPKNTANVVSIERKVTPVVDITETKNTPALEIEKEIRDDKHDEQRNLQFHRNVDDYQRESSEELENPDDDNSSRVTKIAVYSQEPKENETTKTKSDLKSQPYCNSLESLTGYLDGKGIIDSGEEDDNEESDDDFHAGEEVDRPPSKTPSPPPSVLPTPPPLPHRKPSLELDCPSVPPPPLPLTKPPLPPNKPIPTPPKIPERNPATTVSKPLVKTASLRLAYNEQVNPKDIGKVNKLISRFETEVPNRRPRVTPRKPYTTNESEESSEEEDLIQLLPKKHKEKPKVTTTNNPPKTQKSFSIDSVDSVDKNDVELSKNDIPNNNNKKSTSVNNLEIHKKSTSINSVNVLDNNDNKPTLVDIPNNKDTKSTPIDIPEIQQSSVNVLDKKNKKPTPINIPNDNVKKSVPITVPEIQQKLNDSVGVSAKQTTSTDVTNNNIAKSTSIAFSEIQQKIILVNVQERKDENPTTIDIQNDNEIQQQISISTSSDNIQDKKNEKPTPNDIPNDNVKKSAPITVSDIQHKSIANDSADGSDKEYTTTDIPNNNSEIQQKSTSIEVQDKSDKNEVPKDIPESQQKPISINLVIYSDKNAKTPTPLDILNNKDTKSTPSEIQEIQQKSASAEVQDKSVKTPTPEDIPNDNSKKSTTIDIPKIEQKSISTNSMDIPDKKYPSINTLEFKKNSISKDSIDNPDSNVKEPPAVDVPNSHDIKPISNIIPKLKQKSISIDSVDTPNKKHIPIDTPILTDSVDITNTFNNDNKITPIDISDNSNKKPTLKDISNNNEKQKTTSITTVNTSNNSDNAASVDNRNSNDNKSTSIDISNNNENKTLSIDISIKNDKKSTPIDTADIKENKTTLIDISNKNDKKSITTDITENYKNKSTPIDIPDSNGNTPTSIQKLHTSGGLVEKTLEILNDNSGSPEIVPSISISSNSMDVNSNFSQPGSVYGSPLAYPSSLIGSPEVTPLAIRKESEYIDTKRTNRRNVDDDNFTSLDSDEENSYYSISSTSSNRYVVDL